MTIQYDDNFGRHLLRWNGSIWKSTWKELAMWLTAYYAIRATYSLLLNNEQRDVFERVSLTIDQYLSIMPVTFILGFYISIIVSRWWTQFELIPWPDEALAIANLAFPGTSARSQRQRERIARYLNLTSLLVWQELSPRIRRLYPKTQSLIDAGLMTDDEHQLYKRVKIHACRWSLPLEWCQRMLEDQLRSERISAQIGLEFVRCLNRFRHRRQNKLATSPSYSAFTALFSDASAPFPSIRSQLHRLFCFDWVCIPLVYTQVTSLATYAFFLLCLLGRQFLDPTKNYEKSPVDLYFPVFTVVQFMFYVGWLKVGADLMRPFGTDDDDIELDQIVERNMSYAACQTTVVVRQHPGAGLATTTTGGAEDMQRSIEQLNLILNDNTTTANGDVNTEDGRAKREANAIKQPKLRF